MLSNVIRQCTINKNNNNNKIKGKNKFYIKNNYLISLKTI
jgi:hypothetical protein